MLLITSCAAALALLSTIAAIWGWKKAFAMQALAAQREVELAASAHYADEIGHLRDQLLAEQQARREAELSASRLQQQLADKDQQITEKMKDVEAFQAVAKASIMQAGQELSSKLLEDHKREAKEQREQQEQFTRKATESLLENVTKLSQSVATIHQVSDTTHKQMEVVMRALTNPASVGQMSEIGLENALKNLGLTSGQDFFMQYQFEADSGDKLRPDVVILLPQDVVMVIDSKASNALLRLAESEGTPNEAAMMQELLQSTRKHISQLGQKHYAEQVASFMKKKGRPVGFMLNAMYIHSDAAIEKLRHADPELSTLCEKHSLFLIGPAGLAATFSLAKQSIAAARRDENQQEIIDALREFMAALASTLAHVDGVGKNIQQTAKKFSDFARSMNSQILPKLHRMQQMGVEPTKNKSLPHKIHYCEVRNESEVIQAEAITPEDEGQAA